MDFVVARHRLALRVKNERAVAYALWVGALQGQGAANQPQVVAQGLFAQKGLQRAVARRFGMGEFVAVAVAHQAEIFGQRGQFRPLVGRLLQQACGRGEVGGYIGGGNHLDGGNVHGANSGGGRAENTNLKRGRRQAGVNKWA